MFSIAESINNMLLLSVAHDDDCFSNIKLPSSDRLPSASSN
jgi:hypothetical protein